MGFGVGESLAIVSLIPPALHAIRLLINDIEGMKNAPSELHNMTTDLENVNGVLQTLQRSLSSLDDDFKVLICNEQIENSVKLCSDACIAFRERLQKWRKHSTDDKLNWWDRVKVGFLGEKQAIALVALLNTCKSTISVALGAANFMAAENQHKSTKKLLENQELWKRQEEQVRQEGASTAQEYSTMLDQLGALKLEEIKDMESLSNLQQDIQRGRTSIEQYQGLIAAICLQYQGAPKGVRLRSIKIEGSRAVVGVQNLDGKEEQVHLDIDDLVVKNSKAIVGIQAKVDLSGFWKD